MFYFEGRYVLINFMTNEELTRPRKRKVGVNIDEGTSGRKKKKIKEIEGKIDTV